MGINKLITDPTQLKFMPSIPRTWPFLLKLQQVAHILNITPDTVRNWVRAKKIIPIRISDRGDMRFKKEDILKISQEGI